VLQPLGIVNHTRVPAVSELELRLLVNGEAHAGAPSELASPLSELGRTLSHVRAARLALASGAPVSLVIEGTLSLGDPRAWTHSLSELMERAPPGWKVLQLHTGNVALLDRWCPYSTAFRRWHEDHRGEAAYLLTRSGAAAVLSEAAGAFGAAENDTRPVAPFARATPPHARQSGGGGAGTQSAGQQQSAERWRLVTESGPSLVFQSNLPHAFTFSRQLFYPPPESDSEVRVSNSSDPMDGAGGLAQRLAKTPPSNDEPLGRCASLSFFGSFAQGTMGTRGGDGDGDGEGGDGAGASDGGGRAHQRGGCYICGDAGLLQPTLVVGDRCIDPSTNVERGNSLYTSPFTTPPLINSSSGSSPPSGTAAAESRADSAAGAAVAADQVLSAAACLNLGLVTVPLTCSEVDDYFASHGTPTGHCRAKFGALGCCEAPPLKAPKSAGAPSSKKKKRRRRAEG